MAHSQVSEADFDPKHLKELRLHFKTFDVDGDGKISAAELKEVLTRLGMAKSEKEVQEMIASADLDKSGTIEWLEFLTMIKHLNAGKESSFGSAYKQASKNITTQGAGGAQHTYTEEEKEAFAEHINNTLKGDKDLPMLPCNPKDESLFTAVRNGVLLCKLINSAVKDTIDERVINKAPKNAWQTNENHSLALNSAKGIGCSIVNIGPGDLVEGKPHLVLGLVWQIIRIGLLSQISLTEHPELARLLRDGETIQDLLKMGPEEILLRWFNYHLEQAGHPRRVANFSGDIKDSECYTILVNRISGGKCSKAPLDEKDPLKRAERFLTETERIDCRKFVTAQDIVKGNPKLNLAFTANLFNNSPGLDPVENVEIIEESREEKTYRTWFNSMGVECNNLIEDCRDGLVLIKVFDKIKPGCVNWKRVNMNAQTRFKKLENCNYAVELAKNLSFSVVNIGGSDISEGNKKLILGIVWQQMRYAVVSMLKKLGTDVKDAQILEWANQKVKSSGKSSQARSFQDPSLKTSLFLIDLCAAINEQAVNYDLVTPGETEKDAEMNAKYAISLARKIGATVFLMWEDIPEVKSKMIMAFVAALMVVEQEASAQQQQQE